MESSPGWLGLARSSAKGPTDVPDVNSKSQRGLPFYAEARGCRVTLLPPAGLENLQELTSVVSQVVCGSRGLCFRSVGVRVDGSCEGPRVVSGKCAIAFRPGQPPCIQRAKVTK